jgi:7-carboxy-7-deazaguanine synthase (Cx14CxxC type)
MNYSIKEIFFTLQGEGMRTGRAAVFCRFAGCNLWSGLEKDRGSAVCQFCDTDFVGADAGKFKTPQALAERIAAEWPAGAGGGVGGTPYVVFTGGEPLLQLDQALCDAVHAKGFEISIESNGTLAAPAGVDWICVSPKSTAALVQTSGHELKLVYPQADAPPEKFAGLPFDNFILQPMDGPDRVANTQACTDYCLAHPQWRLGLQTHKIVGIP